jgi:glycosyltransferase involved in cell wall biosynthesis
MTISRGANSYKGMRFAVVSHVLPPLPSGQSVLLERLLRDAEPESYCLINSGKANCVEGALPGKCHQLRALLRIPTPNIPIVSWLPLLINAAWGIFDRARQIKKIVLEENCDLLIGCTGDLYNLAATWLASRWTVRPFIAYILDDYVFQWTGFRRNIAAWLEAKFIQDATRVFVLNEFVRRCYVERYGVQPAVIHNPVSMPDLDKLDLASARHGDGRVKIVYTGSIYHAHFDAFRNLVNVLHDFDPNEMQLHIYTSQPIGWLEGQGIMGPGVIYHSHIPQEEVLKVLRQADILFLPLAFHSTIPEVIHSSAPFKTSEYLAIGRPILVHAPAGCFLSWYFRKYSCGAVVDSDEARVLKETLDQLLSDATLRRTLAANARRQAEVDFNIDVIRPKFFDLLNNSLPIRELSQSPPGRDVADINDVCR